MNMAVCRRCDQKVVERSGYNRADGCDALMLRLCGEEAEDALKAMQMTRTDCEHLEGHTDTVGLESIAMFGSFGLFAVWCYTVEKSHLTLQRERKVLLLGFPMDLISYNLNQ
jgi:hypothetical protein